MLLPSTKLNINVPNNEFIDRLATKNEMAASITITKNEINQEVSQKVGKEEIIARINAAIEDGQGIITIQGNQVIIQSDYFNLTANGSLTATNANISGEIIANSGKIAGYTISGDTLYGSQVGMDAESGGHYAFWAGANITNQISAPFRVSHSGELFASNAYITGGEISLSSTSELPKFTITNPNNSNIKMKISSGMIVGTDSSAVERLKVFGNTGNIALYNSSGTSTVNMGSADGIISCVQLIQTSKEESKENFEKLENGLDIVKATDIYKYNLKTQENKTKKHIGFVIGKDYNYAHEITAEVEGEEIGVDTYSMISVAYKAIQEQQEQIEELKEEIRKLKEEK